MQTLTATYRVVTPMFLGGVDPTAEAELRLPSFKGALRFWWRALMWGQVKDVEKLRSMEAELFGSSEKGQSRVQFSACTSQHQRLVAGEFLGRTGGAGTRKTDIAGDGARYLGYGVIQAFDGHDRKTEKITSEAGRLTRACFIGGFDMRIQVRFAPERDKERAADTRRDVLAALKLLGLCGGLGSRCRRGFGSLTLTRLEGMEQENWQPPLTPEEWETRLKAVLCNLPPRQGLPEWTGFSSGQSRALVVEGLKETPLELLSRLGRDFVFFRSWGKNGKVLGLPREGNFKDDHDLMRPRRTPNPKTHPRRVAFGLPHNYGKRPDEQVGPADPGLDRRASPLFFHIHQPASAMPPLGILLFLPSRFLAPSRDRISVGGASVPLAHAGEGDFWKPVHDFLERVRSGSGKEKFPQTRLVQL